MAQPLPTLFPQPASAYAADPHNDVNLLLARMKQEPGEKEIEVFVLNTAKRSIGRAAAQGRRHTEEKNDH